MRDPTVSPRAADDVLEDAPCVTVELSRAGYAAVVALHGEHDLATRDQVIDALAAIIGNVLVDLSTCPFIDSTVIVVLIARANELAREGHRLDLLVPPDNLAIMRVIDVVGMRDIVQVHDVTPPSAASGGTTVVA